ncbi:hypothetical protein PDESU_02382 [Pontiella desulfatans]|uniref:Uncharacterized protein n=1 Tax=Pontiella desulfatans TaxID=2750659 RepID=A0A6C2U1R6_PONDE|nr:hypothetical protein [Pontiella desulfatans]VGO13825.1 hypothetical protein PDESU_02382 [Pontiella desulfatans]
MKKTTCVTLAGLLMACGSTLANFSGGDDFNDNIMNSGNWTNFVNEVGTSFTETNGRLEFQATGVGIDRSNAWKWKANAGSYTNDWTVSITTVNQLNENLIPSGSNETWLGIGVYFNSFSNSFGIDRNKGNNGFGYHDIVTEGGTNGVSQFKEYQAASSDEISFTISFDASAKTISSSYDQGAGSVVNKTMNITPWGMGNSDVFEVFIYGGSRGVVVNSGDVYADNFTATSDEGMPINEEARIHCSSIVGSWVIGDPTTEDTVALTFLTNGTYFLTHDSTDGFSGGLGMERGTYTWDSETGAFSRTVTVDTNGEGGLSHATILSATVQGDAVYFDLDDEGIGIFHRVYQPSTPPSIVGGWVHLDPVNNHDNVVFSFLPNGIYFFAQDGDSTFDPSGQDGMERGVYSWDGSLLSVTALTDTCGEWGMDGESGVSCVVNGNTMTWFGSFVLDRIVDPDCSDLDGDGLPDSFELLYYGNPTNALPTSNGDGDELTDREEFIAGTLPNDGSSQFVVSNAPPSPSGMVVNWNALEGRSYSVKWTDSLTNGFQTLEAAIPYPQNSYTDTVHTVEDGGFYQVDVKLGN